MFHKQALKRAPLDQRLRLLGVRVGALQKAPGAAAPARTQREPDTLDTLP